MKAKFLIWIGLVLQFAFLILYLFTAPEPVGAIRIGLKRLKAACPAEAARLPEITKGVVTLETSGDFFQVAGTWFKSLVSITLGFTVVNIIISILLLNSHRVQKGFQTFDKSVTQ